LNGFDGSQLEGVRAKGFFCGHADFFKDPFKLRVRGRPNGGDFVLSFEPASTPAGFAAPGMFK
jgi:hypothetical protein